jgi:LAO/AO transport system ATPase
MTSNTDTPTPARLFVGTTATNVNPARSTARSPASQRAADSARRVVLAKVGLDGHDRGIKVIARGLRDAGFHVIYAGIWQSPEAVAQAVADEDADWLGISLLNGAHMTLVPRVLDQLRLHQVADAGVVLGGIIPAGDVKSLKELGVVECFGPGAQIAEIANTLHSRLRPPDVDVDTLVNGCRQRDRRALSQLLTRLSEESAVDAIRDTLQQSKSNPAELASRGGNSGRTIAFTGSPGVGKSSLIARLLTELRSANQTVAVLSCDPQSPVTGGALLGDRIRMAGALPDEGVFIRSLAAPSGSQGIAPHLNLMVEALTLFGFDVILIETVGVGQGDVAVRSCAETVVALLQPESGDSVQWEKAGLLEIADVIVIHKSDLPGADRLRADLLEHLHLPGCRQVPLVNVSAGDRAGLVQLMDVLTPGA